MKPIHHDDLNRTLTDAELDRTCDIGRLTLRITAIVLHREDMTGTLRTCLINTQDLRLPCLIGPWDT
jgi:hypothetical protein